MVLLGFSYRLGLVPALAALFFSGGSGQSKEFFGKLFKRHGTIKE